jgi:hypothetical protein
MSESEHRLALSPDMQLVGHCGDRLMILNAWRVTRGVFHARVLLAGDAQPVTGPLQTRINSATSSITLSMDAGPAGQLSLRVEPSKEFEGIVFGVPCQGTACIPPQRDPPPPKDTPGKPSPPRLASTRRSPRHDARDSARDRRSEAAPI